MRGAALRLPRAGLGGRVAGAQSEHRDVRRSRRSRKEDARPSDNEFALRLGSIDDLFWPFDAAPVAERKLNEDVRWALLDDWERVRRRPPRELVIYAPETDRSRTDPDAIIASIRRSLHSASGRLREIDPLTRHELVAGRIGIGALFGSIVVSTALDRTSENVLIEGVSQGILVLGWVALWRPAARFVGEVVPHLFNRRRYAEFANIDVRIVWTS
jgi:hypothetical protein